MATHLRPLGPVGRRAAWTVAVVVCAVALLAAGAATAAWTEHRGEAAATTTTTTATTAPATNSPSAAQNLTVDDSVRAALVAAYVAGAHLKADAVSGTVPGSVFYGQVTATGDQWAVATFALTGKGKGKGEDDNGDASNGSASKPQLLRKPSGQDWKLVGDAPQPLCSPAVPDVLLPVWGQKPHTC